VICSSLTEKTSDCFLMHYIKQRCTMKFVIAFQREYIQMKPARDAAAKARVESEAACASSLPVHYDNDWNIRYLNIALLQCPSLL
jgi:hypothetical protein